MNSSSLKAEALAELTRKPFAVFDCETTVDPNGIHRMVSFAVVMVVDGKINEKKSISALVNPGMPITTATMKIHGITNERVAGETSFAEHATGLRQILNTKGLILVVHNASFDVRVLKTEFALLGFPLPDIQIIDTMYLAATVEFPSNAPLKRPNLAKLCSELGIGFPIQHEALADATATARITEIDELLAEHKRGTISSLALSVTPSMRQNDADYEIDLDHLDKHLVALAKKPSEAAIKRWLERAEECTQLLCPLLAEECLAAIPHNKLLVQPLSKFINSISNPGEIGTLVGGVMRLITPGYQGRVEVFWWRNYGKKVREATRCTIEFSCPDCRIGNPCPIDVTHEYIGRSLLLDQDGQATQERIGDLIMRQTSGSRKSTLYLWSLSVPVLAAQVCYLAVQDALLRNEHNTAYRHLLIAQDYGFEKIEPYIALQLGNHLWPNGDFDAARALLMPHIQKENTNPVQSIIRQTLERIDNEQVLANQPKKELDPQWVKKRRPAGRVRENPYLPK
jgi:DNA polymerase III epsilon subunit-like protein